MKRHPKSDKPTPGNGLFVHRNGMWAKKCKGRLHYFKSRSEDPDGTQSLADYFMDAAAMQAGLSRPSKVGAASAVTVSDVCNAFLERSEHRRDIGEITSRTFTDYYDACKLFSATVGRNIVATELRPRDFARFRAAMATRYAPSRLSKLVTVIRMVFKWAWEADIIDKALKFGPDFRTAGKQMVRQHAARSETKMFEAAEIRVILDKATPQMKAAILLGVSGGMGNNDVAMLPLKAVDLDGGWCDFPRPKTGVQRRFKLWPETIQALQEVLDTRPTPQPGFEDRVFLTVRGRAIVTVDPDGRRVDRLTLNFRELLKDTGAYRKQVGFYSLRHVAQTIGDESRDPIAVARVMGHADGTIGGVYREKLSDERLERVADVVHAWLYSEATKKPAKPGKSVQKRPALRIVG